MTQLADRDYFTDYQILKDPYAYFEAVREHGPVYQPEGRDFLIVTGFEELLEVMRNSADFSAIIGLQGAALPLPFTPEGSDITDQIEQHRHAFHGGDLLVNLDDKPHTNMRALVNTLFTPSRLKANEAYMADFADRMVRGAVAKGAIDLVDEIATPFVTWVVADLLGVPNEDRQMFMDKIREAPCPGNLEGDMALDEADHPFAVMGAYFAGYVFDRVAHPREDVLSELANATYPDGTRPDPADIVKLGMFMFGAGQDTSAKLLSNAMRYIVDQPGLQARLRADPSLIPALLEEVLRLEGSTKQTARLARRDTSIGGRPVKAGTRVLLAIAAANRDPKRWDQPEAFILGRPRIKEHVAFGRSAHTCAGAPLARAEVRVILEKFLEHTAHIDIDEARHGPAGARALDYEPSFIIRGLSELHVKLTPSASFTPLEPAPADAERKADTPAIAAISTGDTRLADLLDNPSARELIDRHFPGISEDQRIGMAKGMTLRSIQKFAPDQFTDAALDALDADLAAIPAQ
ncbi:cytochrome P450 [Novosphingobium album (ex Liu et al. 2023)]|uniref:Cytochrome P450 n=1 Tax=Novosphingobium album (ex Liu et al. 2023) TaxID=3031130 RepID=A0ABT5WSW8_9SPHN|nr:cytochrome P450 [Novosphingobium album (ex Liu et al. 2023)]MDE8653137.1 cytochrome P450 [Novosphingobium album (ex Liu et al. 2023)]